MMTQTNARDNTRQALSLVRQAWEAIVHVATLSTKWEMSWSRRFPSLQAAWRQKEEL